MQNLVFLFLKRRAYVLISPLAPVVSQVTESLQASSMQPLGFGNKNYQHDPQKCLNPGVLNKAPNQIPVMGNDL